jgi:chitodextrinase
MFNFSFRAVTHAATALLCLLANVIRADDIYPPSAPANLSATDVTATAFTLTWTASTDNVGVVRYEVRDGPGLLTILPPNATSFRVIGLSPSSDHPMSVTVKDAADNSSVSTLAVSTLAGPPDVTAPANLSAINITQTTFTLTWNASIAPAGLQCYEIRQGPGLIAILPPSSTSYQFTGLSPATDYPVSVTAKEAAGITAASFLTVSTLTGAPDTDIYPPSAPANLSATDVTATAFTLTWTASTDNVGVVRYEVRLNGSAQSATSGISLAILDLVPGTTYNVSVTAEDAAGNISLAGTTSITTSSGSGPNQPPSISLVTPLPGANVTAATPLLLQASARDPDGTIAKVEFFAGVEKLGQTTIAPYILSWSPLIPGDYMLSAKGTDDLGSTATSSEVPVRVLATLPYISDFEATEGFVLGNLDRQRGWRVSEGQASVVASPAAAEGANHVELSPAAYVSEVEQEFGDTANRPQVVYIDFYAQPVAGASVADGTLFQIDAAQIAFAKEGLIGKYHVLNGDGQGAGSWLSTASSVILSQSDAASNWQRLTIRLDYTSKRWDLYLSGAFLAADIPFRLTSASFFSWFGLKGHVTGITRLDSVYAGPENPLFVDADHDGLDDAWEVAHGLNINENDRAGDVDGDGIPNLREQILGSNPGAFDSDSDGLSDGQELANGTNPLMSDTDSDGMPDGWEIGQGLNPLSADSSGDLDGDGIPNSVEHADGTSANDYYNGIVPTLVSLTPTNGELGAEGEIKVRVLNTTGLPFVNAPVIFAANSSGHTLASEPRGDGNTSLDIRSDTAGFAKAYIRPALVMAGSAQHSTTATTGAGAVSVTIFHSSPKPDGDGDGIPDSWEDEHGLNNSSNDALGDPDQDGQTNYQEYVNGTGPYDFFNGEVPLLVVVSGSNQQPTSGHLASPVIIKVSHQDGSPWPGAPIDFKVVYGQGTWATNTGIDLPTRITVRASTAGMASAHYNLGVVDPNRPSPEIAAVESGPSSNVCWLKFYITNAARQINPYENGGVEGITRTLAVTETMPGFTNINKDGNFDYQQYFKKVKYTRKRIRNSLEFLARDIESTFDPVKNNQSYSITRTIEGISINGTQYPTWSNYWDGTYWSAFWYNGGDAAWSGQRWVNGTYIPAGWIYAWLDRWENDPENIWDTEDSQTWNWTSPMGIDFQIREINHFLKSPSKRDVNSFSLIHGVHQETATDYVLKDDYTITYSEPFSINDLESNFEQAIERAGAIDNVPWGEEWGFRLVGTQKHIWGTSASLDFTYISNDPGSSEYAYGYRVWQRGQVKFVLTDTSHEPKHNLIRWYEAYDPLDGSNPQITIHNTAIPTGSMESATFDLRHDTGLVYGGLLPFFAATINPHNTIVTGGDANSPSGVHLTAPVFEDQSSAVPADEAYYHSSVLKDARSLQQIYLSAWNDWVTSDYASIKCELLPESTAEGRLWAWMGDQWKLLPLGQDLSNLLPSNTSMVFAEATTVGKAIFRFTLTIQGQAIYDDVVIYGKMPQSGLYVDLNRDGEIKTDYNNDSDVTTLTRPFRFWSNDDDDQGPAAGDNMPGQPANKADYNNTTVDSIRDLVDFFPVYLDIKQLLGVLPHTTAGITYKLKQADGALNFVYTDLTNEYLTAEKRSKAFDYQYKILTTGFGPSFTQAAAEATTEQITAAGVPLNTAFLDGIKNNDWGVILVEGRTVANPTHAPLRLVVEKQGVGEIAEISLHLKISPVEQMFRHVNLTDQVDEYATYGSGNHITPPRPGLPTSTGQSADYPDSLTNGKYFVFIHGFNVDADSARGWNAEVFKRMHTMGSKARFVGVQWNGSPPSIIPGKYLDYHKAVFQAFQTGDLLAGALSFANGADLTVAAHSLGNVVTSQAIQSGGFTPTRYYMINAASPIEAYSLDDAAGQFDVMRHEHWVPYETRLYASKWHELFASTPSDKRNALTWKLRFPSVIARAHNFFSGEEDVVADGDQIDDASILEIIVEGNLPAVMAGEYSWKLQEMVKGASVLSSAAAAVLERRQGGWGFSTEWNILEDIEPGPGTNWQSHRRPPNQTATIPSDGLKTEPFFRRFLEPDLMSADATTASNKAGEKKVQYDVLARAIPAMSNAVAANRLDSLNDNNYDMPADKPNGWHDATNRWKHSDFCYVALPYVYPMFQEMISRGGLNQ